jgi:hypothetical protein
MSGLEILGWIAVGFVSFFIIGCLFAKLLINILFFDELVKNPIKDFFYGLFTWQKKVPVYRDIGNNQFSNVFAAMFPVDHYEWVKRGTLKEEIKEWLFKK